MFHHDGLVRVPCILCGEDNTRVVSRGMALGRPVSISICANDGLVYLNPRWCQEVYREFYSQEYDARCRPHECSTPSRAKRAAICRMWQRLQGRCLRVGDAVLDIGAGMGWALKFLSQRAAGPVVLAAVETSERCVRHLAEGVGAELLARDADAAWHVGNRNRFSLVILRRALEHFLQPIDVLQKARHVLSPGGLIYIEVPDMMSPKGPLDRHWFRPTHTYYFCQETLVRAAARADLKPLFASSEDSEVWALFTLADPGYRCDLGSVYTRQLAAIEAYRRRRALMDVVGFLPRAMARRIPVSVKARIPLSWRKAIGRHLF